MRSLRHSKRLQLRYIVCGLLLTGALSLAFADISITTQQPAAQLMRIVSGFFSPSFSGIAHWPWIVLQTIAFALIGVSIGAGAGFCLAPFYENPIVRVFSTSIRAIHEIFWALLLINATGLSVQTGVVAIALPYTGIFAKVFSEYLDDVDPRPAAWLHGTRSRLSVFLFAQVPFAWPQLKTYLLYRYECGLRSSAVLGFIGLPTLGFQLDSVFKQGHYSEAAALLIVYYVLIASIPLWLRWRLLPLYLLGAAVVLFWTSLPPSQSGLLFRFLTQDIVPAPLRAGDLSDYATWQELWNWLAAIWSDQALPGLIATVIVAQLAVVLTAVIAVAAFPFAMVRCAGRAGALLSHIVLVILRTSPEYMLAYIFVLILGPSMLPAILALGLHNGAIVAHLLARQGDEISQDLRPDAPTGVNLYAYELLPRLAAQSFALILYRWEIIVRESAIVGLIGIMTLGFYIDSAVGVLKIDVVVVLLVVTVFLTLAIDVLSQTLRKRILPTRLRISTCNVSSWPVAIN